MATKKLYVQASALNVRKRPTTVLPQGAVVTKLNKGTLVEARIGEDVKITADSGSAKGVNTYPTPFEPDKGEKWVYITSPAFGWAAMQMGSKVYLAEKKPAAGYDGGGNDGGGLDPKLLTTAKADFPFVAFAVLAGAWWWFFGRKK